MPLIFGFVELVVGALFLTSGITTASFAQIFKGQASQVYAQNQGSSPASTPATPASSAPASAPKGLSGALTAAVDQIAKGHGWNASQIADWLLVINKESGGSMTAKNPSSGAYGIAQFINGPGEYAQYGGDVNTLAGQLAAMANYIKERYGNPSAAWAHEQQFNWY